ncbi:uncharacterized protein KY384_001643 [Bacidia gigantensis]|uniref:uncharacterized protein n=1 Tax=Bacidia gigantensis TaxID=2732470 RepID=UPI001D04EE5C|nr:uncharacterized protein KY384_001643 [Bacidia gigantensis]KAG8533902.1 hypothetical protein KY384_001643 [Bacidia gigantensis]
MSTPAKAPVPTAPANAPSKPPATKTTSAQPNPDEPSADDVWSTANYWKRTVSIGKPGSGAAATAKPALPQGGGPVNAVPASKSAAAPPARAATGAQAKPQKLTNALGFQGAMGGLAMNVAKDVLMGPGANAKK